MIMKYILTLRPAFIVLLKTARVAVLAKSISQTLKLEPRLCPGLQHTLQSECLDKYEPTAAESCDPAQHIAPISIQNLLLRVIFPSENEGD